MTYYKNKYQLQSDNRIYNEVKAITDNEVIEHSPFVLGFPKSTYYKVKKEIWAERMIRKYKIFKELYSDRIARTVTDKELQKKGADFLIYSNNDNRAVYVDIKGVVGNYGDCIPLEIDQYGKATFTKEKVTDYVLYIYGNTVDNTLNIVNIPINVILNVNINDYEKITSDNGSGTFVKIPYLELLNKEVDFLTYKI